MAIAKLRREVYELDLPPGLVPRLKCSLVKGLAELEGNDRVILGVKDENRAVYHSDPLVRHEGDVTVSEAGGEEPVEPRHLAPDPAHGMVTDLVVDVVERRLEDEAGRRTALEGEEGDEMSGHSCAEAVAPHDDPAGVSITDRHQPVKHSPGVLDHPGLIGESLGAVSVAAVVTAHHVTVQAPQHLVQLHTVGPGPVGRVPVQVENHSLPVTLQQGLVVRLGVGGGLGGEVGAGEGVPDPHTHPGLGLQAEIAGERETTAAGRVVKIHNTRPSEDNADGLLRGYLGSRSQLPDKWKEDHVPLYVRCVLEDKGQGHKQEQYQLQVESHNIKNTPEISRF